MTNALVWLIAFVLMLTAGLHGYWALGGLWPAANERRLARTVVGANGISRMPARSLTATIAVAIAVAGLWPMLWLGWIDTPLPRWLLQTGMLIVGLVFLARGGAGFVPAIKRMNREQPFATLNARYFSPLIILLGLAFSFLLLTNSWGTR